MERQSDESLSFTLLNFAGYYSGSMFGDPIYKKEGPRRNNDKNISNKNNYIVTSYNNQIEETVKNSDFDIVSRDTGRDANLSQSANIDTNNFISKRDKIASRGTSAEKYRFISGSELILRTCTENEDAINTTIPGYKEIVSQEPRFDVSHFRIEIDKLQKQRDEMNALIQIIKRG